jgi:hypothetical protein
VLHWRNSVASAQQLGREIKAKASRTSLSPRRIAKKTEDTVLSS